MLSECPLPHCFETLIERCLDSYLPVASADCANVRTAHSWQDRDPLAPPAKRRTNPRCLVRKFDAPMAFAKDDLRPPSRPSPRACPVEVTLQTIPTRLIRRRYLGPQSILGSGPYQG